MVGTKQNTGTPNSNDDSPKRKASTSKGVRKPYVKRACINCKNAHAACEPTRPCKRCINMGIAHECVDAERKKPNRRPRKKKTPDQNGVVSANEFVPQSAYPYMSGQMMPGFTYGFPAFPPNQYAPYPYQQFPMMMNSQQMNGPPLYLHNRPDTNATNTSPPSPSSASSSSIAQPVNMNSQMMITPYHPSFPINYWSDPAMQNQYLNPGGQPIPLGPSQSKKRRAPDSDDEVDSDNDDGEFDDEMNGLNTGQNDTNISIDGENMSNQYDVTIPHDFILDSPPESPHQTEIPTAQYGSPVDDTLHTSSALALQLPPQSLQLHTQNLRYPYQNDMSLFDEPFSPTSPLHQRFRKQDYEKDDNIIDLITENAATMLEDHDNRNNASKLGSAMNVKPTNKGRAGPTSNTSLMRVEDAPWTQLLSDIFKEGDNNNGTTGIDASWLNSDSSSALDTAEPNNFGLSTTNGALRKATLSQDQLEQLLKHVWEKQSSQSKEILELKQELRRVLNELQNLKLSREDGNNNGSTRTTIT
jgi:hypothetical protein